MRFFRTLPLLMSLFAGICIVASAAEAVCDVKLERIDTASWSRSGGYDAFDPIGYADQFGFEVLHLDKDGKPCEMVATVEATNGTRLEGRGRDKLDYDIRTDATLRNGSGGVTFRFDLTPGERRRVTYFIFLPPSQFVGSGSYEGQLAVNLAEDLGGTLEAEDRRDVLVRATAGSGAKISFVGAVGRRQTVDFGELSDGKSSTPVFLDVRSTADYEIRLKSEEGGQLVQRSVGKTWRVPYQTTLDGNVVDLDKITSTGRRFSGPTDPVGDRLPLQFSLGSVGDQRAGNYRDRVTIEIFPTTP